MGRRTTILAAVLAVGATGVAACTSLHTEADPEFPLPDRDDASVDGAAPEDATAGDAKLDEGDASLDLDASGDDDASDDAMTDAGPCSGKPNGFAYKPGDPQARCCNGQTARLDSTSNCGGCGIKCAAGTGCGQLVPGHFACKCSADSQCVGDGYGSSATCYLGGGGYCNCQCPGGAATCAGQCKGGAVCHVVSGNNYCAY